MKRPLILAAALLALTACGHSIQTTSGTGYLNKYPQVASYNAPMRATTASYKAGETVYRSDADMIREAASVEPLLEFPARFGLARIENGRLTPIPTDEAEMWLRFAERHEGYGSFTPINPIVAEYAASTITGNAPHDVTMKIRLGAARQHMDAVLIYEVATRSRSDNTGIAFADLTILGGAILPTRDVKAGGVATALLLDVRNGYPYGTADAQSDLNELSPSWGSDARRNDLTEAARRRAVANLVPEIASMFHELARELPARRRGY